MNFGPSPMYNFWPQSYALTHQGFLFLRPVPSPTQHVSRFLTGITLGYKVTSGGLFCLRECKGRMLPNPMLTQKTVAVHEPVSHTVVTPTERLLEVRTHSSSKLGRPIKGFTFKWECKPAVPSCDPCSFHFFPIIPV